MKKINILFANNFSTIQTGSPQVVLEIMRNLPDKKYQPFMQVQGDGPLLDAGINAGVPTQHMDMPDFSLEKSLKFIRAVYEQVVYLKKNKIDILHLNYVGWRDCVIIAAKILKIPIVIHCHNIPIRESECNESWNVRLSDRIVAVSEKTLSSMNLKKNLHDKSIVVYNAVEVEKFEAGQSIRPELDIPGSATVIAIVGQISERKGGLDFLAMAKSVCDQRENVLFLIVGKPPVAEASYLQQMQQYCLENNLQDKVIFTGVRNDIENIMASADLLVTPSKREPFGKVIVEAMAAGTCPIAYAVDGIPEVITDGVDGVLVEPNNIEELVNQTLRLIDDSQLRKKLGSRGKISASEKFSMPRLIQELDIIYRELLR